MKVPSARSPQTPLNLGMSNCYIAPHYTQEHGAAHGATEEEKGRTKEKGHGDG